MGTEDCPIVLAGRRKWTSNDILFLRAGVVRLWNRAAPLFKVSAQLRWKVWKGAGLKTHNRLVGAAPIVACAL
jgi:hypothetical protein